MNYISIAMSDSDSFLYVMLGWIKSFNDPSPTTITSLPIINDNTELLMSPN